MKVYICSVEGLADAASYDAASLRINPIRREKLGKIRHMADKKRSLCAGLLLNYALCQFRQEKEQVPTQKSTEKGHQSGVNISDDSEWMQIEEFTLAELLTAPIQKCDYRKAADGKPFLADVPGFYFNLSHSGDYALCAWGPHEIGADLQKTKRAVTDALAGRVLTQREYADNDKMPQEQRAKEFYRVWAIKESCCKLTGRGLIQNFQDMEIFPAQRQIGVRGDVRKIYFQVFPWKENYWLAISYYGERLVE